MPKRHDRIITKALQFQANGKECLILLPIQHGHSHYRLHKLLLPRVAQSGRSFSKLLADQQIFERHILELWLESFKLLYPGRTNQVWNGESNVLSVPYHGEFLTNPLIPSHCIFCFENLFTSLKSWMEPARYMSKSKIPENHSSIINMG